MTWRELLKELQDDQEFANFPDLDVLIRGLDGQYHAVASVTNEYGKAILNEAVTETKDRP
jgi:hypothetical protein